MRQYAIVIERGTTSHGAYVPDLPGCAAVAQSEEEVRRLIREAIVIHIKAMIEDGDPVPEPASKAEYVALPHAS